MLLKLFISPPLSWPPPPPSRSCHTSREWKETHRARAANHEIVLPVCNINCIVLSWNCSKYVKCFQDDFTEISCFLLYRCFCGLEPQPRQTLWMRYRDHRVPWRTGSSSGTYFAWAILTPLFRQFFSHTFSLLPSPSPGAIGLLWVVFLINLICSLVFQGPQMPECWICLSLVFSLATVKTHFSSSLFTLSVLFWGFQFYFSKERISFL